ncbi:methyltransferase domain-containing protein [Methylonatrum kenyense]|uniref:methyltransferase domain-containing protein n=1 Tax=Methylonatrum kenyense TaxID=455253 RepID=UPI0020C11F02|nr:methyltransferase domain-containing protein [Methylonatrum kenyense]MCK8514795.1 methyltransferase domain-containing protein [Methylonatrum kenyense]
MKHDEVKTSYGETLQGSEDLQTDACCTPDAMPLFVRRVLSGIHPEVLSRYYGCGLVVPEVLEGARILDLGCGSGRDCYALSKLVGEHGEVVGVDMTEEQLAVARRHVDHHTEAYGYARPNVAFHQGYIERLDELGLEPQSFDLVISNCVLNLSPDKARVLEQVHGLLKPGGEMYFSDVYADRRIPAQLTSDPVLYGECLSGALYWNDFLSLAKRAGFGDPRLVEDRPLAIGNPAIEEKTGPIRFFSATYRLFRIDGLEPACEDYGQAVIYRGTIPEQPHGFRLDKHHWIDAGRVFPVCGNTWRMLRESRLAPHFDFVGDGATHYGIFTGCGTTLPFDDDYGDDRSSSGCC